MKKEGESEKRETIRKAGESSKIINIGNRCLGQESV